MKFTKLLYLALLLIFAQQSYAQCGAFAAYSINGGVVTFYDSSYSQNGHITEWSFGNGSSNAYGQYVTATYTSSGTYYVCMVIQDTVSNCMDSSCFSLSINLGCNAGFNYSVDANNPLKVNFTNTSTGASSYLWRFQNGNTDTATHPSFTYSSAGYHSATLITYDSSGSTCDSIDYTFYLSNSVSCDASFYYYSSQNTVYFYDSTLSSNTLLWHFGDGTSSTSQNPTHQYNSSGTYTVCLYVYTQVGSASVLCDSSCQTVTVSVPVSCNASFTYSVDSNNTVYFTNTSTNASTAYWRFGGSSSSTAYNLTHTFSSTGYQTVCLTTYDSLGNFCDSVCQSIYIAPQNSINCVAGFTYTVDSINMSPSSYPVSFWNYSDSLNYLWDFGDSSMSTLRDPSHIYTASGTYTVCLYLISAYDSLGLPIVCDTFCTSVTVGSNTTPSCQASYYLGLDSNNMYNLYIINNSTGTNSSTSYMWTFGDGDSSTTQNPTHQYASFGLYQLCLTITTSANGSTCTSTYCDSIGMDSTGALLKRDGFGITVLNESELLSVKDNEVFQNATIYPNPSTGLYTLELNLKASQEEVSLLVFNALGQSILTQSGQAHIGLNTYKIDLRDQVSGMYYIAIRAGDQVKHAKLHLRK